MLQYSNIALTNYGSGILNSTTKDVRAKTAAYFRVYPPYGILLQS